MLAVLFVRPSNLTLALLVDVMWFIQKILFSSTQTTSSTPSNSTASSRELEGHYTLFTSQSPWREHFPEKSKLVWEHQYHVIVDSERGSHHCYEITSRTPSPLPYIYHLLSLSNSHPPYTYPHSTTSASSSTIENSPHHRQSQQRFTNENGLK